MDVSRVELTYLAVGIVFNLLLDAPGLSVSVLTPRTNGWMDKQKISPFYRTIGAAAQKGNYISDCLIELELTSNH